MNSKSSTASTLQSNTPALFQALITDLLRDMLKRFVFVYLDDSWFLVFSSSLLKKFKVLKLLLGKQLFIKPEECKFQMTQAQFIGFIINPINIQMGPWKVQAVTDGPTQLSTRG